jgi:DNA-binding MarR family transcriptional regulator
MADIKSNAANGGQRGTERGSGRAKPGARERERLIGLVELLFFAYREFTAEPDEILSKFEFGRAHHRVLHFINRRPGLRVADLLDILKITKQSLARVLKQLVDRGFVDPQAGEEDRRERRLHLTPKGRELAEQLAEMQIARVYSALAKAGPDAEATARAFLAGIIASQDDPPNGGRTPSSKRVAEEV